MAKFSPSMLRPATEAEGLRKLSAARTIREVAVANITKMKSQYFDPSVATARKNWRIVEGRVVFAIRVSNTALVLAHAKVEGSDQEIEVREMSCPEANWIDALDYYAARIAAGEFDAQLTALEAAKSARQDRRRANKEAKEAGTKPA